MKEARTRKRDGECKVFRQNATRLLSTRERKVGTLGKELFEYWWDEIVVQDKTATIRGSYAALAETMLEMQKKSGQLDYSSAHF